MFNLSAEDRIREWRRFRLDLPSQNTLQCLESVAKLWATAPMSSQFLAPDLPETWPTAWELISDNYYDDVGLALGMYYTLFYSEIFSPEDIMYTVYKQNTEIINTVTVHEYVLNFNHGAVVDRKHIEFSPIFQYNSEDIKT